MIQIQPNNLEAIADHHWEVVNPISIKRLRFCISFFEAALGKKFIPKTVTKIENEFGFHYKSAISIVEKIQSNYILNKKRTKKKKVTETSILSFMNKQDTSLISAKSNHKLEFEFLKLFLEFIQTNLKDIILGKPSELQKRKEEIENNYAKYPTAIKALMEFVFPYETFTENGFPTTSGIWNNYSLTKRLGVQVCPYCNRSWINTVTNGKTEEKVINPQLDHFYSQKEHPYFRLSFYNLIPSCEYCNARLKKEKEFDNTYLHPYSEGYGSDGKFRTIALNTESSMGLDSCYKVYLLKLNESIFPDKAKKIDKNHELFKINKIYEAHGDIISEIYREKYISGDKYLDMLSIQFPVLSRDRAELYRIGFGNYFNEKDFNKRLFAKLTKDVAEQLGLIK